MVYNCKRTQQDTVSDMLILHGVVWSRVVRTLTYMLYLIHIETCGYYAMSAFEQLGLNEWVYDGEGRAYVVMTTKRL